MMRISAELSTDIGRERKGIFRRSIASRRRTAPKQVSLTFIVIIALSICCNMTTSVSAFTPLYAPRSASLDHTCMLQCLSGNNLARCHSSSRLHASTKKSEELGASEGEEFDSRAYIAEQEASGRVFTKFEQIWWQRLYELEDYKTHFGNCNVPINYAENLQLAKWVMNQRAYYKRYMSKKGRSSGMTKERVAALEGIGFEWVIRIRTEWDKRYEELKQYKEVHGDCDIPTDPKKSENPDLVKWVIVQRREYRLYQEGKHSQLTDKRMEKLNEIGFCWDLQEKAWNKQFSELKAFQDIHGHCNVGYKEMPKLRHWVSVQRKQYRYYKEGKKSLLTEQRIAKLNKIGFVWNVQESKWAVRFAELLEYKAKHGDYNVPPSYNRKLYHWTRKQGRQFRLYKEGGKSQLTEERAAKLTSVGFSGDPCKNKWETTWEMRFKALEDYKSIHGDCDVTRIRIENRKLANWAMTQRAQYRLFQQGRKSSLTKEKIAKLENIGFQWTVRKR